MRRSGSPFWNPLQGGLPLGYRPTVRAVVALREVRRTLNAKVAGLVSITSVAVTVTFRYFPVSACPAR